MTYVIQRFSRTRRQWELVPEAESFELYRLAARWIDRNVKVNVQVRYRVVLKQNA